MSTWLDVTAKIIIPVLTALIGVIGSLVVAVKKEKGFKQKIEENSADVIIGNYSDKLKRLIDSAVSGGQNNILDNADLILRARDDLRQRLDRLQKALNSEFDKLNGEVEKLRREGTDNDQLLQTVDAAERLRNSWSGTEDRLKTSLRILAAEIGFTQKWF